MSATATSNNLTSGRLLARNTVWNLFGQLLPMAAGMIAIPILVRNLGVVRFGLLSLAWIVIGYFSLFDLGIGRAVTKLVADRLGTNDEPGIPPLVWTALMLIFILGLIGGLLLLAIAPWFTHSVIKIPNALQKEVLRSCWVLAGSIPVVTLTSGLRGVLEAQQRFALLNLIRIPTTIFYFVGPVLVLPFSHSLFVIMLVLLVGRLLGGGAHFVACIRTTPSLRAVCAPSGFLIGSLINFGGWMTVTNIVGPIMLYTDRFLIGALVSVSAVAFYTAPLDMLVRLTVIPSAIVGVLFPAFAVCFVQDQKRAEILLGKALKYVFLIMFPIVLGMSALAPEGLNLWLGNGFSQNSSAVLRFLAVGLFVNSFAQIPFVLLQGIGKPDVTAKIALLELPIYFPVLYLLTKQMGIHGAAIAWTLRAFIDAELLFFYAERALAIRRHLALKVAVGTVALVILLSLICFPVDFRARSLLLVIVLLVFLVAAWFRALGPQERLFVVNISGRPSSSSAN